MLFDASVNWLLRAEARSFVVIEFVHWLETLPSVPVRACDAYDKVGKPICAWKLFHFCSIF